MEIDYMRQLDIVTPDQLERYPVTLIGAGGIGSPTALALAKLGVSSLTVYDDDTVEPHNLPNQFYPLDSVGQPKVSALRKQVYELTGTAIHHHYERYTNEPLNGIVIGAVDSMFSRQVLWENVQRDQSLVDLYIDGRMAAEYFIVYAINPKDAEQARHYQEAALFSDEEAEIESCTSRSTIYCGFGIAAVITSLVKKFARGQELPLEVTLDLATYSLFAQRD